MKKLRIKECNHTIKVLEAYMAGEGILETEKNTGCKTVFFIGLHHHPAWDYKHNTYDVLPPTPKEKLNEMLVDIFHMVPTSKGRRLVVEAQKHVENNF